MQIKSTSIIYIFCPANFATGGPEALHQLAHHLNKLGFNAFMYYENAHHIIDPVHPFYKKYTVPYVKEVENDKNHLLILPEAALDPLFKKEFSEIRKVIWWLSVTYYYLKLHSKIRRSRRKLSYWIRKLYNPIQFATLDKIREMGVPCIAHSHYSLIHLKENNIQPIGQISDYMSKSFFELVDENLVKEDIIIYNPKKNGEFLDKIIKLTPKLRWMPLIDLSPEEVAQWMNKAKLYVDFGFHPGKERMPRESCIMNCCMIIGRDGSAMYDEDMPILDKYRFEKEDQNIPKIVEIINQCLTNYNEEIKNFIPYKKILYKEEEKFILDIKSVFVQEN